MLELETETEKIIKDIETLAFLLNRYGLCNDTGPLYDAQMNCQNKSDDSKWEYDLNNLIFNIPDQSRTIPHEIINITICLSLSLASTYILESEWSFVTKLTFDVEITGFDDNLDKCQSSWHLDKHISEEGDGINKYYHPEYHIAFGGDKMRDSDYDYGAALILNSPRIAHPPLEAILGIDWILRNFFPIEQIKELVSDLSYQNLLHRTQKRIWHPYYSSIANLWSTNPAKEGLLQYYPSNLIPNIIPFER